MNEKAQRAKWREELIDLQSMIEPAKNEEIARRAIDIAWNCLEKAENQAMMLQIYQGKALQHVESVGEKKDCVEVVRCMDCRFWNEEKYLGFCSVHQEGGIAPDDFCSNGERKEKG